MEGGHDWHVFDEVQGLEVACVEGVRYVRRVGSDRKQMLTDEEWDQVRKSGPDPEIMERLG